MSELTRRRSTGIYKDGYERSGRAPGARRKLSVAPALYWLRSSRLRQFAELLKVDLFADEVFRFKAQGEVKSLSGSGATPWTSPTRSTPTSATLRRSKVNGRWCRSPTTPEWRHRRGPDLPTRALPSRYARPVQDHPRAQQDQAVVQGRVAQGPEHAGPRAARSNLRRQGLPPQKVVGLAASRARDPRDVLPQVPPTSTIALCFGESRPRSSPRRSCKRLKQGDLGRRRAERRPDIHVRAGAGVAPSPPPSAYGIHSGDRRRFDSAAGQVLRALCRATRRRYISLGRGKKKKKKKITTHAILPQPPRCPGPPSASPMCLGRRGQADLHGQYCHVHAWDRHRLFEDLSRPFADTGIDILEARCCGLRTMLAFTASCSSVTTQAIDVAIIPPCSTSPPSSTRSRDVERGALSAVRFKVPVLHGALSGGSVDDHLNPPGGRIGLSIGRPQADHRPLRRAGSAADGRGRAALLPPPAWHAEHVEK